MRFLISLLSISLFFGCHHVDKPKKPDNLISKDTMVSILYDISLFNAAKGIGKKTLEQNDILPKNFVFEKYHIDSLQFALSNTYYAYDIEGYEAIVEKVKARVEQEKAVYDALNEQERRQRDSSIINTHKKAGKSSKKPSSKLREIKKKN
ncbi:MAG: DUF4296 domain-containing protein [Gelidibacter sp.]